MNNENITLNPDKLNTLKPNSGLPLIIKTIECLKNISFTADYTDLINTPKKLSEFEDDIAAGGANTAVYKESTEKFTYTYNPADLSEDMVKYNLPETFNPDTDSVELYLYNIRLIEGNEYTVNGKEVTLGFVPSEGNEIIHIIKRISKVEVAATE